MDCYQHLLAAPDLSAVPQALSWLNRISLREKWSARIVFILSLCLDEALTNIVYYAFNPPVAHPVVDIRCTTYQNKIVLTLRDNGCPYDPTAATVPTLASSLDDALPGGHGMRLMRHYLNDIAYSRDAEWNELSMSVLLLDGSDASR